MSLFSGKVKAWLWGRGKPNFVQLLASPGPADSLGLPVPLSSALLLPSPPLASAQCRPLISPSLTS